jgi:hypothetical protein
VSSTSAPAQSSTKPTATTGSTKAEATATATPATSPVACKMMSKAAYAAWVQRNAAHPRDFAV